LAGDVLAGTGAANELDLLDVTLRAPIPRPGKIICIGLNYRDHAAESNQPIPDYPAVFSKYANSVIGPGEPIVIPRVTEAVDYEGELAFVIGRRARFVSEQDALDAVAGYMAFNDVSARDFQMRTSQWTIGKTFDTFAPMGPALVTADEIADPHDLDIRVTVSGEVLQSSNTRHLIFSIQELVAYLSQVMTLEPGDVIATGTPSGVGFARTPPRFLRPGDVVEVEIKGLGTLVNPVAAEV
jgi:2-keto-4-pentenoate hydratase/2-oxohepta-3-ene-1,7-dioic acid hydratase in catechol pathway